MSKQIVLMMDFKCCLQEIGSTFCILLSLYMSEVLICHKMTVFKQFYHLECKTAVRLDILVTTLLDVGWVICIMRSRIWGQWDLMLGSAAQRTIKFAFLTLLCCISTHWKKVKQRWNIFKVHFYICLIGKSLALFIFFLHQLCLLPI